MSDTERLDWLAYDHRQQELREQLLKTLKGKDGKISEFAANAYIQLMLMDT